MLEKIKFTRDIILESCKGGGNIFREGEEVDIIEGMVKGEYVIKEPLSNFSVKVKIQN